MNKDIVQTFVKIVQLRTISRAAEALFTSQSTISYRLQSLESELNVQLLKRQRGNKTVILTEQGLRFYQLALEWLELEKNMYQTKNNTNLGKLVIGSMDSISQFLISSMMRSLREKLPEIDIIFKSYHSSELYPRLSSHDLDIAFGFYPIYYELAAVPVFKEKMYMISLGDSIYPDRPIHPSELKKSNQILFTWNNDILIWNNEWWSEQEAPYVHVDSCGLLTTFLTKKEHWALSPASVAEGLKAQRGYKVHEILGNPPDRICYLLHRKKKRVKIIKMDKFLDAFNEELSVHPWRYQL